jgi:thiopeptide-type bacteriocin biosynthesis protein
MRFDINSFDKFIYRIPNLAIDLYHDSENHDSIEQFLRAVLQRDQVKEAILIASPEFSKEVDRFLKNEMDSADARKMKPFYYSALKYINRMCSRCTPFGTFAGCGIGTISANPTEITPLKENHFKKHIHWDSGFLLSVTEQLMARPEVRPYLNYARNNSVYGLGDSLRYVEYYYNLKGNRIHTLSSFKLNPYLEKISMVSEKSTPFETLAKSIIDDDIDLDDATDFINELIDSKFLLSELEPVIVGEMYDDQVLAVIQKKLILETLPSNIRTLFAATYKLLISIKNPEVAEADFKKVYEQLSEQTNQVEKKYVSKDIFQVDSEVISAEANIAQEVVRDIKNGMRSFYKLTALSFNNDTLSAFKKKFSAKYENQLVPLLEALDPEIGLNYSQYSENLLYGVPLVDDLPSAKGPPINKAETLSWEPDFHGFLLKKILASLKDNSKIVDLKKADIEQYSFDINKIPASMNAFVNIIPDADGKYLINFKDWGSDSALTLIGRFTLLGKEILALGEDIARFEDDCLHENQVLAEVNHLADSRTGNITSRSRMRSYEIPYITNSGSIQAGIIKVNDLYIRLENNEFKIYSKELNVQVIPVLSNAHNFNKNPLPLYKFLCDLQNDSKAGTHYMSLNLGPIARLLDHIPRIQLESYIFRPATWVVRKDDFNAVINMPFEKKIEAVRQYFAKNNMPESFYIGRGDNKLYIDFAKSARVSLLLFIEELEKDGILLIEENVFAQAEKQLIANETGSFYHELVIPFKNEAKLLERSIFEIKDQEIWDKRDRSFSPGSPWLYFKVYCGVNKAESLLTIELPPILKALKDNDLIADWFFIRFTDPEHHLRIRFKLKTENASARVMHIFQSTLQESIDAKFIEKIVVDTYIRELERYGGLDKMITAEKVFCKDSELVLSLLEFVENKNLKDDRWMIGMAVIDRYINAFHLNDQQKYHFILGCRDWLAKEFNANKAQRRKISEKYRENKENIEQALFNTLPVFINNPEILRLLDKFSASLDELLVDYRSAENGSMAMHLRSFAHMFLLRFSSVKNRSQEYVIYSFLEIHYKSALARHKISV